MAHFGSQYMLDSSLFGQYGSYGCYGGCNVSFGRQVGQMFGGMAAQMGTSIAYNLIGNILGGAFNYGMNSVNGMVNGSRTKHTPGEKTAPKNNVDTSEIDKKIKAAEDKISNPEKYINKELITNVSTAQKNYNNAKKELEDLEKNPVNPPSTENEEGICSDYNTYRTKLDIKKAEVKNAESALKEAQEAKENAEQEVKEKAEKELSELQAEKEALVNLSDNINKKDGSWLTRKIDGKGTIKDKLAAFRKASDKFRENPYSLTNEEVETLLGAEKLIDAIQKGDKTEGAQAIIEGLQGWAKENNSYSKVLDDVKKAAEGTITKEIFEKMQNHNCFEKKDRKVGDTLKTIYVDKFHNKAYVLENGTPKEVTQTKNGNIFHQAEYE